MPTTNRSRQIQLDAAVAGPLFMLSAALLFTVLNLLVKMLGPEFTIWHIGFFRFFGGVLVLILVFGGVQLLSLGIVSEYVGRIYEEVKRRPRYVIDSTSGIDLP